MNGTTQQQKKGKGPGYRPKSLRHQAAAFRRQITAVRTRAILAGRCPDEAEREFCVWRGQSRWN